MMMAAAELGGGEMSQFRKTVKFLCDFYDMPEDVIAQVCLELFANRTFNWRRL